MYDTTSGKIYFCPDLFADSDQINKFILNSQNIFLFRKFYCVNKFPEIELEFGKIDKIKMFWILNLCVEKSVTISHSMIGQKQKNI